MLCRDQRQSAADVSALFDERRDLARMRQHHRVAAFQLGHFRARPPGHRALRRRRDHVILACHHVIGRLRLPGHAIDLGLHRLQSPGELRDAHEARRGDVDIGRERRGEFFAVDEEIIAFSDKRSLVLARRRRRFCQCAYRFPGIRSKCREIDEAANLRIVACFRDDHSSIGMPDENHRMSSLGDHTFGLRDIVAKRDRRLLDDEHLIACIRKYVVGALPARSIDEGAMDKDNGNSLLGRSRRGGLGGCDRYCGKRGDNRLHDRLQSSIRRHCCSMSHH